MNLIKNIKDYIYPVLLISLLFSSLFFVKSVPFFLIFMLLFWFFGFRNFNQLKVSFLLIAPFISYILIFIAAFFFSDDKLIAVKVLERQTPFLILPLVIFCKKWSLKEVNLCITFLVNTTLAICIFSILKLIYFYFTHLDFVKSMDSTYLQWKLPHLIGFHPTYFGFIIVSVIVILLSSFVTQKKPNTNKILKALVLTFYLLYLSPRTAVLCLLLVWALVVISIFKQKIKYKKKYIVFFSLFVFIIFLFFSNYQYLINKYLNAFSDRRFLLWKEAIILIKENYFILGEGLDDGRILIEKYIKSNNLTEFEVSDIHNQYLMNYLDLGILGLLTLIYLIINPVILFKEKIISVFSCICLISMMTESILYVTKGIIIFIIIQSLFILKLHYSKLKDI